MKKINIGHLKVSMLFVMVCLMVQIPLHASEIEGKAAGEK